MTEVGNLKSIRLKVLQLQFEDARRDLAGLVPTDPVLHLARACEYNESSYLTRTLGLRAGALDGSPRVDGTWSGLLSGEGSYRVTGYVFSGAPRVFLFANDHLLLALNTSPEERLGVPNLFRSFSFTFSPSVTSQFPKAGCQIAVSTGEGLLINERGGIYQSLTCDHFQGGLFHRLAQGFVVSKHGKFTRVQKDADEWPRRVLELYAAARDFFDSALRKKLFIFYGTLLGYCRNRDFIPHDDDFDTSYFSRYQELEDVRKEALEIGSALAEAGFTVSFAPRSLKVGASGVFLDVFPAWHSRDRLWIPNTTSIPAAVDMLIPESVGIFKGTRVYLPTQAEAFLAAKYGSEWRKPDPGYRTLLDDGARQYLGSFILNDEAVTLECG